MGGGGGIINYGLLIEISMHDKSTLNQINTHIFIYFKPFDNYKVKVNQLVHL